MWCVRGSRSNIIGISIGCNRLHCLRYAALATTGQGSPLIPHSLVAASMRTTRVTRHYYYSTVQYSENVVQYSYSYYWSFLHSMTAHYFVPCLLAARALKHEDTHVHCAAHTSAPALPGWILHPIPLNPLLQVHPSPERMYLRALKRRPRRRRPRLACLSA